MKLSVGTPVSLNSVVRSTAAFVALGVGLLGEWASFRIFSEQQQASVLHYRLIFPGCRWGMEGKEYPTRSKSGVRKIRTPWDNSSSFVFDELVGVKRSPKTPPTGGKVGHTPSPKTAGGKKTPGQNPAANKTPSSKEKKVQSHCMAFCCLPHFFHCFLYSCCR